MSWLLESPNWISSRDRLLKIWLFVCLMVSLGGKWSELGSCKATSLLGLVISSSRRTSPQLSRWEKADDRSRKMRLRMILSLTPLFVPSSRLMWCEQHPIYSFMGDLRLWFEAVTFQRSVWESEFLRDGSPPIDAWLCQQKTSSLISVLRLLNQTCI